MIGLGLLLVTTLCIFMPFRPAMPGPQVDESWALGMNQALAQGLTFGRDIILTFGPYSAIFSEAYHPSTHTLMICGSVYLAICYWFAVVHLTRDTKRYLLWAVLVVLAGGISVTIARDTLLLSYPLIVGVVCFRIATRRPGSPDRFAIVAIAGLCSAFGLLPLIKGSMAVGCGLIGAVVCGVFASERNWRFAATAIVSPLIALVVFWAAAGQSIAALPGYFRTMLLIISGYGETMAIPGNTNDIVFYLIGCVLLFAGIVWERTTPGRRKIFLFGIYFAYLFIAFKAGFVRHDSHALIPAQSLLFAALLFSGTLEARIKPAILVAAAFSWGYVDHQHLKTSPAKLVAQVGTLYRSSWEGLHNRLTGNGPNQEFYDTLASLKEKFKIPLLEGTTDVYSHAQGALIASGNRWNPRPIFQSYVAYDPYLADKNRAHLLGDAAPDNVVFKIESFDARLPALDDGASWPALITRYRPVSFAHDFLILRRTATAAVAEMTTISSSRYMLGKSVMVPTVDGFVVAEITVKPSLFGRLAGALFKSHSLLITFEMVAGQPKTYRFVSSMGKLGVMVSPLIENTTEFAELYAGTSQLSAKQVSSFKIESADGERDWQHVYQVTFKSLTVAPILDPRQSFALVHGDTPLDEVISPAAREVADGEITCEGVIDRINGFAPPPGELSGSGMLTVSGWAARSAKQAILPRTVLVVLTDPAGRHSLLSTRPMQRVDVGNYFADRRLDASGYTTTVDVSRFAGTYALGVAFKDGDRIERCSGLKYAVSLKPVTAP